MRFTPSSNWSLIASASNRVVTWTVSVRKTTVLSDSLSTGTWLDVTNYLTELPSITQRIEYELGQFSSDSVSFTARNIDWWEANIFNASDSEYLELKITATLSSGSTVTSDTFYAFSGFIDKVGVQWDELGDTVSFDVFTADEIGNRISALSVNTQYYSADVDGSATVGLVLPRITGVYVVEPLVPSVDLTVGLHVIEYVNITNQIRLDDGAYETISATGFLTCYNSDLSQAVSLYINMDELETNAESLKDYLVVDTYLDPLPKQPYYGISIGQYLKNLYSALGVSTSSIATNNVLKINSHDSTKRISYYDFPPNNSSVTGERVSICNVGTDIWVGIGNKLYRRTPTTEVYTLKVTLTSGLTILKLIYNDRNDEIWIASSSTSSRTRANRITSFIVDATTESNTLSLTYGAGLHTINVIDYNYTGASYKYGLMLVDNDEYTQIAKCISSNGSGTITSATVDTNTMTNDGVNPLQKYNLTGFGVITESGKRYTWDSYDRASLAVVIDCYLRSAYVNGSGSFVVDTPSAVTFSTGEPFAKDISSVEFVGHLAGGGYDSASSTIYYWTKTGEYGTTPMSKVLSPETGGPYTSTAVVGISDTNAPNTQSAFIAGGSGLFYYSTNGHTANLTWKLYELDISGVPVFTDIGDIISKYGALTYDSSDDVVYGVDRGIIYQYDTEINLYTKIVFEDVSIKEALSQLLKAFNLIGTISSHKKAFVYRRGNNSGTIQTTGNNATLDTSNTVNIQKLSNDYQKIAVIEMSSGDTSTLYDGTTFLASVLSESRVLSISNDAIPENIVKDMAKWFFTFYNTSHDRYTLDVNTALMQYEVMDGASVTYSTTKLTKTATGLIVAQTINKDGSLQLEVIF